ncbi:unnamed protein product [Prorocentrum cordatum]|uniref:WW domain-containing protein n=1 Tax=Prorocentrum cordatum TaxID=2364126 RepID=A0ABN9UYH7_9DINO|nr:unnamed protein product [Polarella glacialis]
MVDVMALFEAEIGKMGSPSEEKQVDETQGASAKRGRADGAEDKSEETGQGESKISLVQEAKIRWKQRQHDDTLALEEAGKGKWIEHKDVDSGAWYYFNPVTKVSSWERPSDFVEPCLVTEASIVGPKWTVSKDPTSRRFYYS